MHIWTLTMFVALFGTGAVANAPEISLTPEGRPIAFVEEQPDIRITLVSTMRPKPRPDINAAKSSSDMSTNHDFQNWVANFRKRATAQGISPATLDEAFEGVIYDPEVIRRDQNQSEFTKTIWQYLDSAVSDKRIASGVTQLHNLSSRLEDIETKYGVDKEVLLAVWGMESSYGTYRGDMDVVRSLSTLAFDGRRGRFFESQLIAALEILQSGDIPPRQMTGSWAGAMGHTQFIPTSYLAYAVDFTGDGKRNIWSDDPTDALASTAAYLARFGWVQGQPWGVEVVLPDEFNYSLANRSITKDPVDWALLGVKDINGQPVPSYGQAAILLPAGGSGAAFMIFKNFSVIERYNAADAYVIGVGHLSDRLRGGRPIQAQWPTEDRSLTFVERQEMQKLLTRQGFSTQGADGRIGPNTIAAVRAYQVANGLMPDGYASLSLLKRLR
ncbi:lytic murein transglycosylase [Zongyanglinia huanghaiensis]|uniref:Lytic murein transglycosylase n=1 Tax=Parasedimentitalea huanghaiensis TaxID=2682100 RepID=A0A6L6WDH9_9RHOB|nr:lytic murein transglycosylase [Zongyanglinia huanghaiensis]